MATVPSVPIHAMPGLLELQATCAERLRFEPSLMIPVAVNWLASPIATLLSLTGFGVAGSARFRRSLPHCLRLRDGFASPAGPEGASALGSLSVTTRAPLSSAASRRASRPRSMLPIAPACGDPVASQFVLRCRTVAALSSLPEIRLVTQCNYADTSNRAVSDCAIMEHVGAYALLCPERLRE